MNLDRRTFLARLAAAASAKIAYPQEIRPTAEKTEVPFIDVHNHGSISKRGKRKKVWVARYSEDVTGPNGVVSRVRRAEVLGSVAEIATRRQAEQILAERLRFVNSSEYRPCSSQTFR
ncbi:MAG TPA: hypothetical protein VJS37_13890, partial [Terriglobales bacterium]|nr:hypothetical protein [Terriglobales bacterium]